MTRGGTTGALAGDGEDLLIVLTCSAKFELLLSDTVDTESPNGESFLFTTKSFLIGCSEVEDVAVLVALTDTDVEFNEVTVGSGLITDEADDSDGKDDEGNESVFGVDATFCPETFNSLEIEDVELEFVVCAECEDEKAIAERVSEGRTDVEVGSDSSLRI